MCTQAFDWQMFWSAFGAIGSTVGSLATAIALFVAIQQYRQPMKKRLRIKLTTGVPVFANQVTRDFYYCITVSNVGVRDVIIDNIYLRIGKRLLMLNMFILPYNQMPQPSFPVKLEPENSTVMYLPQIPLADELRRIYQRRSLAWYKHMKICVTDKTGDEHNYITGYTLRNMMTK